MKPPVLCRICQKPGHGPLTCPERQKVVPRERLAELGRLATGLDRKSTPRPKYDGKQIAPPGVCEWCDARRAATAAKVKKYRTKEG